VTDDTDSALEVRLPDGSEAKNVGLPPAGVIETSWSVRS
jgi:hypothetical protein